MNKLTNKQRKNLCRILLSGAMFFLLLMADSMGVLTPLPRAGRILLYLFPYLLVGIDVLSKAARNLRNGNVFDENFLMMIATFGAFAIDETAEAVAVMLFYQVGEFFQDYAVGRSRASIAAMMEIVPEEAHVERDGQLVTIDPEDVKTGETIVVRPGERVPLDGVVLEGTSFLDTAALTGESVPRAVHPGEAVMSGCVNGQGSLKVRTTAPYEDSTVARILDLVENAGNKKARTEQFITRFARYYTPAVTIGAVLLALLPPLVFGGAWQTWLKRACVFLIVSCPCALVISVPLGFFGGIGAASRRGILVKGSSYLESVAAVRTLVFDKTGTLTRGTFAVTEVSPAAGSGLTREDLLHVAAAVEEASNHPIAAAIRKADTKALERLALTGLQEVPGRGLRAEWENKTLLLGNARMMEEAGIFVPPVHAMGTVVYLAHGGVCLGHLLIADELKDNAVKALQDIRACGVRQIVMLTGDRAEATKQFLASFKAVEGAAGEDAGAMNEAANRNLAEAAEEKSAAVSSIDAVYTDLLPADKVAAVEELLQKEAPGEKLAFAGDGINDAPVLMRADVGIAMGALGSDAAIEAADIVLMDDDLSKIATAMRIGKKTMRIVRQNICFALGVKAAVLLLGALGVANLWEAVFADVGVAVLAIANSMRTLQSSR